MLAKLPDALASLIFFIPGDLLFVAGLSPPFFFIAGLCGGMVVQRDATAKRIVPCTTADMKVSLRDKTNMEVSQRDHWNMKVSPRDKANMEMEVSQRDQIKAPNGCVQNETINQSL